MKQAFLKTALILFLLISVTVESGLAQNCEGVARKVQRLDRTLQRVGEMARSFDFKRAVDLVMAAKEKRDRAVNLVKQGRCVAANAVVDAAFADLENASRLLLNSPVERLRRELKECFRRADDVVLRSRNKQAVRLLDKAKKNSEVGEQDWRAGKVEKAVEQFRVAKQLCEQAIQAASQTRDVVTDIRNKFDALRERARDAVEKSRDPVARRTYDQALALARKADESWRSGNPALARRLLNQGTLLLLRTLDLASGTSPTLVNQTQASLFRLQDLIEQAADEIRGSRQQRALTLFERARRFAGEAETAIQTGQTNEALWKIELAENMVRRAQRLARSNTGPQLGSKIAQEIENTSMDLEAVESQAPPDAPRDVDFLLRMAQVALTKAEQAANAGMNRVALEGILASQRFINRAERVLDTRELDSDSQQIQLRLSQLDAAIAESETRVREAAQDWSMRLLENAKEFRQLAQESYDSGNYSAASEAIQVSFELLRKSVKNIPNR